MLPNLPSDLSVLVLAFVSPKDVAAISSICHSWREAIFLLPLQLEFLENPERPEENPPSRLFAQQFPALQTLRLISSSISPLNLGVLFSHCPLIENLSLIDCPKLFSLAEGRGRPLKERKNLEEYQKELTLFSPLKSLYSFTFINETIDESIFEAISLVGPSLKELEILPYAAASTGNEESENEENSPSQSSSFHPSALVHLKSFQSLTKFSLSHCFSIEDFSSFFLSPLLFPHEFSLKSLLLKDVQMNFYDFQRICERFLLLETISLVNCPLLEIRLDGQKDEGKGGRGSSGGGGPRGVGRIIGEHSSICQSLMHLYLDSPLVDCYSLSFLVSRCRRLETLEILGLIDEGEVEGERNEGKSSNNSHLSLESSSLIRLDFTQDDVENDLEYGDFSCLALKFLHLGFCPKLKILHIGENMKQLEELRVWSRELKSEDLRLCLSSLTCLTSLSLGYCALEDSDFSSLLGALPLLGSFSLSWMPILKLFNWPSSTRKSLRVLSFEGILLDDERFRSLLNPTEFSLTEFSLANCPFLVDFPSAESVNEYLAQIGNTRLTVDFSPCRFPTWEPEQWQQRAFQF